MLTMQRILKGGIARVSRSWQYSASSLIGGNKECNACNRSVANFYVYGGRRFGCPFCRSSTRERFVRYALSEGLLSLPDAATGILHVAPNELSLIDIFSKHDDYRPVDLFPEKYPLTQTKKLDLMEPLEPNSIDLAYLSHILEHVPDDRFVLKNLYDALRPGREAWFLIPMWNKPTQDGSFSMPAKTREKLFGQWDHVRMYGPDFEQRISESGFEVHVLKAEQMPQAVQQRYGFQAGDWIFVSKKRAAC